MVMMQILIRLEEEDKEEGNEASLAAARKLACTHAKAPSGKYCSPPHISFLLPSLSSLHISQEAATQGGKRKRVFFLPREKCLSGSLTSSNNLFFTLGKISGLRFFFLLKSQVAKLSVPPC